MDRRLEAGLVNATVVAASLAVTYLVVQFVFFRFLLADLPPNLRPYLPDRARVFAQTSAHEVRRPVLVDGQIFPVSQVYAHSQRICEGIRRASLANGTGFVGTRPALRAAGARAAVHGPRDWRHLNEAGYRLLGALVAGHLDDRPSDACDDRWPEAPP